MRAAVDYDEDALMVVILPDTGRNYLSKLYSDSWLLQYGLMEQPQVVRVQRCSRPSTGGTAARHGARAREGPRRQAVDRLQEHGISQAPVVREGSAEVTDFVGSIQERALLDRIFRD